MRKWFSTLFGLQQLGLIVTILVLGIVMTRGAGSHVDHMTGQTVNNFLNPKTLIQVATDTSFFAIMAVGMMMVIISAGIDLSVGSIYAISGVLMAMAMQKMTGLSPGVQVLAGIGIACGIGLVCGLVNGVMVSRLGVHPFIITLGTMWIYRGIAFVTTNATPFTVPQPLNDFAKASLGLRKDLAPLPLVVMLLVTVLGTLFLQKTTWGRRIFAVGGNVDAARYSGVRIPGVLLGVYALSGLTAGIAGFLGSSFYGASASGDGSGYELYVIASAVVGGASLNGGKGSAVGAFLGALLIVMIRQSITTLGWDRNYEWIIIGIAIIFAVVIDTWSRKLAEQRMVKARA